MLDTTKTDQMLTSDRFLQGLSAIAEKKTQTQSHYPIMSKTKVSTAIFLLNKADIFTFPEYYS